MAKKVVLVRVPHRRDATDYRTFFVTSNTQIVVYTSSSGETMIVDELHGNGGWRTWLPQGEVEEMFAEAFEQLG